MMNDNEDHTVAPRDLSHELSKMKRVVAEELHIHIVQRRAELAFGLRQRL